ncbi:hypothetical protein ILYODFUR_009748 [Ilyodon furcidens]|uniref:Uncharacterized protein n=2 Tax=Goodeidae TaxID=28758 RepID=A0ABV0UES1_9TELE
MVFSEGGQRGSCRTIWLCPRRASSTCWEAETSLGSCLGPGPLHSAVSHEGSPLCQAAREGCCTTGRRRR